MDVTVNIIELASNLAHEELESFFIGKIFKDENSEELTYTEEAQEVFNELYDKYHDIILQCSDGN